MRIISPRLLREFIKKHAAAGTPIYEWIRKTEQAEWKHFPDARQTFGAVDQVTLPPTKSGMDKKGRPRTKTVTIFNVGGNNYRVIASINYKTRIVYTLFALTHAEYNKEEWKKQL